MEVTVTLEEYQVEILQNVAARIGCDDYEEVFGRSLCIADVITWHLAEDEASIEMLSPSSGLSTFLPSALYGGPGIPHLPPGHNSDMRLPEG